MASPNNTHFRFPWREENTFRLLIDGNRFFPEMLHAIDNAKHYVALNMYLMNSGSVADCFIEALLHAAQREVQVYLLLDDFGASGLNKHDRERMIHTNIQIAYFNPLRFGRWFRNLLRDHRKLLLLDGKLAFVGGAGIADDFNPPHDQDPHTASTPAGETKLCWRETMVEIKGPCVVDWHTLFASSWPVQGEAPPLPAATDTVTKRDLSGKQMGRVILSQATTQQEIRRSVNRHMHSAEHRIWMTTAYFVPSWRMQRALRKAAQRGVDVRLLLPGEHTDHPAIRHAGRRYYYNLLRHGVRIFEYQPRFSHSKILLCDQWSTIGSSNFDRWNLLWNLEANQAIDDQHFAETVRQMFNDDFKQCIEIDVASWQKRSWQKRCLEWYWGWVDALLYRFSIHWSRRHRSRRTASLKKENGGDRP